VNIGGGSSSTSAYDEVSGYRFFINADYSGTAAPGSLTNAVEITNYIVLRGLNASFPNQSATINSGVLTLSRESSVNVVDVETQGGAGTDSLDTIVPSSDMADGDLFIIRGTDASHIVTITSSGNIVSSGDWSSADKDTQIILMYLSGSFYETSRSGGNYIPAYTAFRTEGFPFLDPTKYGVTSVTAADNTTKTVTVNSDKNLIAVTGTVSLTTGDYIIDLSTTGAVAGDVVFVKYVANVTVGSYKVSIEGHDLSDVEALLGGMSFLYLYDGSAWRGVGEWHNLENGYQFETSAYYDNSVTVAKVETTLKTDIIVVDVSFETGEQGDYKIKMPYSCTVNEIYARATKAIAATDAGTITPKNNGGTTMTSGVITFSASDAFGTAYTVTPSSNNTFAAGELMTLTPAKATAGGKVQLSIKVTKS
jgi:hypothetical protein